MGDAAFWRLTGFRALYVGVVLVLAIMLLMPLGGGPGGLPGPDLILALTIAWAMRRPEHLPVVALAGALLLADLLLMRPPGLLAASVVLAVEVIRSRQASWRELPPLAEWAIAAALITGITLLNALLLAVFFVDQPSIGQTLIRLIFTIAVFPIALLTVLYVFKVRTTAEQTGTFGAKP